jgi:hypothetical protein
MEAHMDTVQDGKYRTSDLYYAAFLKTAGVALKGTEREGSRVVFVFEGSDGLKDLKDQFFNRTAKVSALCYADEIKTMKTLTFMDGR